MRLPVAGALGAQQAQQSAGFQAATCGGLQQHAERSTACCACTLCLLLALCRFVVYFISRIQLLRTNGLEPIVVFDGGRLPIKGEEEESRRRCAACARMALHGAAGQAGLTISTHAPAASVLQHAAACAAQLRLQPQHSSECGMPLTALRTPACAAQGTHRGARQGSSPPGSWQCCHGARLLPTLRGRHTSDGQASDRGEPSCLLVILPSPNMHMLTAAGLLK